jgi:XTP/dITP diphosphohydrolase
MKLVFASQNSHKAAEIQTVIPSEISICTLTELGITEDIPETAATLEGNATMKMEYLVDRLNLPCFADDTGLEIDALHGEPGVYSARYAGEQRNSVDNMQLVLEKLTGKSNRKARFRTVIALWWEGNSHLFEGIVEGTITHAPVGDQGFGYDPIFQPAGSTKTFAEMTMEEKNQWSHRARAVQQLVEFLTKQLDVNVE